VPLGGLRAEGFEVFGSYFNPNVHPYREWERRRDTLGAFAAQEGLRLLPVPAYEPLEWWRAVVFREAERCRICYQLRLRQTALLARRGRFDAFSTTLLYSRFQKHELIREFAETAAKEADVPFLYRDWRPGWREGVEASKALGLYRQPYCGCLPSEQERFAPKGARA
jgi:predicted adenine nucleotide alpha hydrolase (AANH) superfamily ATPase